MEATICDVCGDPVAPGRGNPKRCSAECRKAANRTRARELQAQYRETNPEKMRARGRANHHAHREKRLERKREYREEHAEEITEKARTYYYVNRDRILEQSRAAPEKQRERRAADPVKWRAIGIENARLRSERLDRAPGTFTDADWSALLDFFDHSCAYCGSADDLRPEHVVPLAREEYAPTKGPENVLPACRGCNGSKHSRLLIEWRPELVDVLADRVASFSSDLAATIAHF